MSQAVQTTNLANVTTNKSQEKTRYSDAELDEFKILIIGKKTKAQKLVDLYSEMDNNLNSGDGVGKNDIPYENASQTHSTELNKGVVNIQEKLIRDLNLALVRIENKTYGICRVTGKLIDKERLKLVPHSTLSIEAKNLQR